MFLIVIIEKRDDFEFGNAKAIAFVECGSSWVKNMRKTTLQADENCPMQETAKKNS